MATLHNEQEVARKDIRDGDLVLIEKGGDIIPKVVEPVLASGRAGRAAVADADRPARSAAAARQARGRGRLALRERVVPGAHPARPRCTSRRGAR